MSLIIGLVSFILFLCFQAQGIVGGDSGDLVTAAATRGVPHPPGYPLYTFFGWLFNHIPIYTPSWRTGLLSSIPHAITVALIYEIVFLITRKRFSAVFASFTLLSNYLFFLYSVTPEVFALLDVFVAGLLYLSIRFIQTKRVRFIYLSAFLMGLALSHHQMIVFIIPACIYAIWSEKKSLKAFKKRYQVIVNCVVSFLLGLISYLYIPIAAHGSSIINWDRVWTFSNFLRLVTRADYGTFVSSSAFGSAVIDRLLDVKAFGQYILMDFSFIGIILAILGCYKLIKSQKKVAMTLSIAFLVLGPIFLFYASFPLLGRFTLGTYERFLLPSYVVFSIFIGVGFVAVGDGISKFMDKIVMKQHVSIVKTLMLTMIYIYPIILLCVTLWRFWGLPTDRTADNLGKDILNSLPNNSMLLIMGDTSLFTTQYVRYALGVRTDVLVIHLSLLQSSDYQKVLTRVFPQLKLPSSSDNNFLDDFITQNATRYAMYSFSKTSLSDGWYWVPHGLVNKLYSKDSLPSLVSMRDENDALWKTYHNPTSGILSRYNHLMLSDVTNTYASQRESFGETLMRAGDMISARKQFEAVIQLNSDTQSSTAYSYIGLIALFDKQCQQAITAFSKAQSFLNSSNEILLYQGITYRDCVKNQKKADEYLSEYNRVKGQNDVPLELAPQ